MTEHCVIITGMHRSGTSLVSSILQKAGVHVGNKLLGPDRGNLRGHFEDVDFYHFHDEILRRFGQTLLVQSRTVLGELTPDDVKTARALIQQRKDQPLWGWKDPRTALFLDFWHSLLPQACYVLVYRHPLEVVLSLFRRGSDMEALANPLIGLYAWQAYNQAILDFYGQHSDVCLLTHISSVTRGVKNFFDLVVRKLKLPIQQEDANALYHPAEFRRMDLSAEIPPLLEQIVPGVVSLYMQLETLADLPDQKENQATPASSLSELQQLGSKLASYGMLGREQQAYMFSLLLAVLAPEAVIAGKESLDHIRTDQISQLQIQLAGKETRITNLQQQISDKEANLKNLQQQLADKIVQVDHLQQQVALQESKIDHLHQQTSHLHQQLSGIKSTKAWRLVEKWYGFKEGLRGVISTSPVQQVTATLPNMSTAGRGISIEPIFSNHLRRETKSNPAVLFISHYAGRTGAPILLLNFLKWFKANTEIPFEILLKDDGPLRAQFEAVAPTILWNETSRGEAHLKQVVTYLEQANIGLIYANTITNGDVLAALATLNCPVVTHVHELGYWINHRVHSNHLAYTQKYTKHYIAVSQAVKQNLVKELNIPESKISLIYEFIPTQPHNDYSAKALQIRKQLGIPAEALIVGGSGTTDWRKGADLFVQLARAVHQRPLTKPVHFVWVGGQNQGAEFGKLWYDVTQSGLEQWVHFVGTRSNPLHYFAAFDIFALVSREDPFPLVNLEVASLAKPIVCFDDSGGAKEFVAPDCGFVVPYLDIDAMAERVVELLEAPDLRQQLGQVAAQKVCEHHDLTRVGPMIVETIKRFLGESG